MANRNHRAEDKVRRFYDTEGWSADSAGIMKDAALWEDLRPCAENYVRSCRLKILRFFPKSGELFLDAASGPIQYPEYLAYSQGFRRRVCVDISQSALDQAKEKLGDRGQYVKASILELPFPDSHFDAVASLHTIYHIDRDQQEAAVRQLIRVAKPEAPIVVVYANPDRLIATAKRLALRLAGKKHSSQDPDAPIYYSAHSLEWWERFKDTCSVELYPWRGLTAQDSRRLAPGNAIGKGVLKGMLEIEERFPKHSVRWGAYPTIVIKKSIRH